jgi:hypothetical protein
MAAMSGAWLRRKVDQPWDGGPHRLTMYFATLDCETSKPSLSSSPWDARRTPQRIFGAHPANQRAQFPIDLRSASKRAGFPPPVPTEAGSMPTYESLRSDDRDGPEDRWKQSIQQDQEQAIPICELGATSHLALQHNQLMTERRVLGGETDRVRKRKKSAIIAVDVRRFGHAINTDEVFGTHT